MLLIAWCCICFKFSLKLFLRLSISHFKSRKFTPNFLLLKADSLFTSNPVSTIYLFYVYSSNSTLKSIIQISSILIQTWVNKFDSHTFFLSFWYQTSDRLNSKHVWSNDSAPCLNIYLIIFYLSIWFQLLLLLHNQMHIVRCAFYQRRFPLMRNRSKKAQQYLLARFFTPLFNFSWYFFRSDECEVKFFECWFFCIHLRNQSCKSSFSSHPMS